jgi:hypothetical protein
MFDYDNDYEHRFAEYEHDVVLHVDFFGSICDVTQ